MSLMQAEDSDAELQRLLDTKSAESLLKNLLHCRHKHQSNKIGDILAPKKGLQLIPCDAWQVRVSPA